MDAEINAFGVIQSTSETAVSMLVGVIPIMAIRTKATRCGGVGKIYK
jgi:hypothetical protein